jgi:hypothetical protein
VRAAQGGRSRGRGRRRKKEIIDLNKRTVTTYRRRKGLKTLLVLEAVVAAIAVAVFAYFVVTGRSTS